MTRAKIAIIAGDGIGPEVIDAALPIIEAAARTEGLAFEVERLPYSADHYLRTGETLPDEAFEHLREDVDGILVGALGDPRVPGNEHARDILLGLRFRLDLYINFRPTRLFHPKLSPLRADRRSDGGSTAIDFVIFRENTEGQYLGKGRSESIGTPDEVHVSEEINTRRGVARIIESAFEWAAAHGKTRVTMSDKSNAIPYQRIWGRLFGEIGERYPGIQREHRYVDALALELVREPERFQVIVTTNLYGDILSDLGAGLIGGLGIAASANLHPGRAGLYEPVHGSAPPLVGKGVANPMATVLTGALMLDQLGCAAGAAKLERAVERVVASGPLTPDLGGTGSTTEVAAALMSALA
ncbi:MAG: isocitrate/isopropylmalate family dehydrogenase [Gemmatimonadales bacterium]